MPPTSVALARRHQQLRNDRLRPSGHGAQHRFDLLWIAEKSHPRHARLQCARSLWPAQQQFGEDRQLAGAQPKLFDNFVPVFDDPRPTINARNPTFFHQRHQRARHLKLAQLHARFAVALLIAAIDERVLAHRICVWNGALLLDQDTDDALLRAIQHGAAA
jgi:hypothetical protein